MLLRAARERSLDLARSVIVGDRPGDVQAGRAAGLALGVLVESGHAIAPADRALADACVADLRAAAAWILARRPSLT
jgi:D-glycero-D-manno-heptose 1,7-bisphosphate phosphatase